MTIRREAGAGPTDGDGTTDFTSYATGGAWHLFTTTTVQQGVVQTAAWPAIFPCRIATS
jgi:hypothetical protein